MAKKTTAMRLQDLSIRRCGHEPQFKLLPQKWGHNQSNEFVVDVMGVEGHGNSKREAKQNIAKKALSILDDRYLSDCEPQPSTFQSSNDWEPAAMVNHIGNLGELCSVKKLPMPVYRMVSDAGTAHDKVFGFECRLLLLAHDSGSTKKLAKQNAARQMYEMILAMSEDDNDGEDMEFNQDPNEMKGPDSNIQLCDCRLHLKKLMMEMNVTYDDIGVFIFSYPRTDETLTMLLKKLSLTYFVQDMSGIGSTHKMVMIRVNTNVPLYTLGHGSTFDIAKEKAMNALFIQIYILSS